MKFLDMFAKILLLIGGLNWGIMALSDVNIVTSLFGGTCLVKIIYGLVGLSAVYLLCRWWSCCCSTSCKR